MRTLTKRINKRNKHYKPTIGLEIKSGRRVSFNAELFYIEKANREKAEAKRYAREFIQNFLNEECPELMHRIGILQHAFGSPYDTVGY